MCFITGYVWLHLAWPITTTVAAFGIGKVMSRRGCKLYLCSLHLLGVRNVSYNDKFPFYLGDFGILESITVFYCSVCLYVPLKRLCVKCFVYFQWFCILSSLLVLRIWQWMVVLVIWWKCKQKTLSSVWKQFVYWVCLNTDAFTHEQRELCKDNLRGQRKLKTKERLFATSGKTEHCLLYPCPARITMITVSYVLWPGRL